MVYSKCVVEYVFDMHYSYSTDKQIRSERKVVQFLPGEKEMLE